MDKIDLIDLKKYKTLLADYEELVNNIEALKTVLEILYDWLDGNPNLEDPCSYYDLVCFHEGYFNLLNLALNKMGDLGISNKENVKVKYEELREINK